MIIKYTRQPKNALWIKRIRGFYRLLGCQIYDFIQLHNFVQYNASKGMDTIKMKMEYEYKQYLPENTPYSPDDEDFDKIMTFFLWISRLTTPLRIENRSVNLNNEQCKPYRVQLNGLQTLTASMERSSNCFERTSAVIKH